MTLNKKLKTRETTRKTVDRNLSRAKAITENFEQDKFAELFSLRDTIVEKYDKIKGLDEEILSILVDQNTEQAELDQEDDESNNFTIHFKTEIFKINSFIDNYRKTDSQSLVSTNYTPINKFVKLPTITLKRFDREPENWQTFYDNFECAIHNNADLSDVQKLTYLQNLVDGKASDIIYGIKLSNENYKIALDL